MVIVANVGDDNHEPTIEKISEVHKQLKEEVNEPVLTLPYYITLERLEEEDLEKIKISNPEKFLEEVNT